MFAVHSDDSLYSDLSSNGDHTRTLFSDISNRSSWFNHSQKGAADHFVTGEKTSRMSFQNHTDLVCDFQLMLTLPDMCDVKFLVGPDYIPVYGIRALLATRSQAFGQLIQLEQGRENHKAKKNKSLVEKLKSLNKKCLSAFKSRSSREEKARRQTHIVIRVEEFDPDTFRRVILYLHTGRVNLTVQSVVGVMNAADKYGLVNLRDACFQFACSLINGNAAEQLTTVIRNRPEQKMSKRLIEKIHTHSRQTRAILHLESMKESPVDLLEGCPENKERRQTVRCDVDSHIPNSSTPKKKRRSSLGTECLSNPVGKFIYRWSSSSVSSNFFNDLCQDSGFVGSSEHL